MKILLYIFATIAFLDILGFSLWTFSGQLPADGFFMGKMTATVLKAIIK
jgi:hypothetical protein